MIYIVQPGDTLWSIAARFGVSAQAIAAVNQLNNPDVLVVGRRLFIPTPSPGNPVPPTGGAPLPGGSGLEARVSRLERELIQVTSIIDHHRQQMAALERRVSALERQQGQSS